MQFSKTVTINAPAEKVWENYGRDFANIGKWSTAVSKSVANAELPNVNGSPVGGRLCETSFGKISEEFTAYDDSAMTLSFKGVFGSVIFKDVLNSSVVTSIDENTSQLEITSRITLRFLGIPMAPLIKMQLNKAIDEILDDLKYYVENDEPSPRKLASLK